MKKNLLTIVVPVYNTEIWKLERCLKSIPDNENVYLYIYDDSSTIYNTEEVVSRIINDNNLHHLYKDGNKFIKLNKNKGLGFVRNESIRQLHDISRYILFLDSDDELDLSNIDLGYISEMNKAMYTYSIELISGDSSSIECSSKYLNQKMIPYLVTPIIYNTSFLYDNEIYFDESRRIFEDIIFSVRLWSAFLSTNSLSDINLTEKDVIYKYYLEGESLTRNNKKEKMMNDLYYWIDWIKDYYNNLNDLDKDSIKIYLFNRIRYESLKILSMKMGEDGIIDKYSDLLNNLKPYNIDKILV